MPSLFEYATEWSEKSLLHKYSTLRKQFNEQIKRLGAKVNDPRIEKFKKGGYKEQKTIRDIENLRGRKNWSEKARREDWALRITELEQLLKVRTYSLSGRAKIRSDTIKSLQEKGLKSVNNNNFDRFVSFMNWAMDYYSGTFSLTSFTQTRNWTVYGVNRGKSKGSASVGGRDNVYDDQQWLVRELIEAYHLTGKAEYLRKAEYLTEYVLDGWDCTVKGGKERGGIPWGPGYYSKHSCSNGPMVSPLVWLSEAYKGKGDQATWRYIDLSDGHTRKAEQMPKSDYYLMFARKVYAFQKDNLMMKDGSRVYADNLNGPSIGGDIQYETVDGERYRRPADLNDFNGPAISYNSGTMLSGAADLYRVTGDNTYLEDLQALDVDSFRAFAKLGQQKAGYYSYAIDGFNNWFNGVLLRGYVDAFPFDGAASAPIDSFQKNLDYAWDNYLNENMLPPSLLVGWNTDRSRNNVEGMFVFAFAAEYAVMSRYLNK